MRSPERVLNSLTEHSKDSSYKFERLYRILFNEELFYVAYQEIASNDGSTTKGSDGQSIDNMSLARIATLIASLKDESYQPHPSRRVYIPKKNRDKRPLGIPAFEDKLVQEVVRMILGAMYEGNFECTSHGFRPNRSCHTALLEVQRTFTGAKWFIEGDIKGFFDNINHNVMISILSERIIDERFIRLIRKFLNAGYMEDWTFHKTYSGCPQGGIISPILANIYLDKFDKYMKEYIDSFRKGKRRNRTPEYRKNETDLRNARNALQNANNDTEKQNAISQIRELEKARVLIPHGNPMDTEYARLTYVRYADDWLCGVIGSKEDCKKIKEDIKNFLFEKLQLELSEEKTLITNAQDKANFLSYKIYVRQSNLSKRDKAGRLIRNYTGRVVLEVSSDTIKKRLLDYSAMKLTYHMGKEIWKATSRYSLKDCDDLEIVERYNSEIRGFYNYYCIANNSSIINSFKYIMEYSMYKTYATKYRTTKSKIIDKYRINKDFGIKYKNAKGIEKTRLFYNKGFKRQKECLCKNIDTRPNGIKYLGSTSLIDRLRANVCEICGKENTAIEIHHVKKLKGLKGKTFLGNSYDSKKKKDISIMFGMS